MMTRLMVYPTNSYWRNHIFVVVNWLTQKKQEKENVQLTLSLVKHHQEGINKQENQPTNLQEELEICTSFQFLHLPELKQLLYIKCINGSDQELWYSPQ